MALLSEVTFLLNNNNNKPYTHIRQLLLTIRPWCCECGHTVREKETVVHTKKLRKSFLVSKFFILLLIIHLLTARVVGAPQIICNQFSQFSPVLHCLLGLGELQVCPFPDVVFPPLLLSALSSSSFHCALQDGFGQT